METIAEYLHSRDIRDADLVLDGTIKSIKTDKFNGWYIGDDLGSGKRRITIEDWRTRDRRTLSEGFTDSPEEAEALEASRKKYEEEKLRLQLSQKKDAARDVKKFTAMSKEWTGKSEYLTKKKILWSFGALQIQSNMVGTEVIIPLQDENGELWNYQSIQEDGFKTFQPGAKVDGLWFELTSTSEKQDENIILLCEGYATACSVQMAVPHARVICAFSSGNLALVAESMRKLHKYAKIIICGDDDWKLEENAGRLAAEAAALVCAGTVCLPVFPKVRGKTWTDFNDLHCGYSLEVVRAQLEKSIGEAKVPSSDWIETTTLASTKAKETTKTAAKTVEALLSKADSGIAITPYINGVSPMPMRVTKQGNPILPKEWAVAHELWKYYEGRMVMNEGSLFLYDQNHWAELSEDQERDLFIKIQVLYAGEATNSKVTGTLNQFKKIPPKAPRNLFLPNPYVVNFNNGTLYIENERGKWGFRFGAHNKLDYCTHLIPIDYDVTRKVDNPKFREMLENIFAVAPDREEKIKAIQEMYGACVAPIFPHLFMLHGPGGSGKTSLIMPAQRLVHKDNWSSVEPHEFKGFTMESMVGKLVNIVTDINLNEPIDDNHIKKIEDRIPIRIDRKFKGAVMAPLPAVHIFGGNDIPPTFEKGSGAHTRRWTFLEVAGFAAQGNYSKSYANEVFDENPVGVLNFALEGLERVLANNGHYFVPATGKAKMQRWQMEHDPIAQFIHEIESGGSAGGEGKLLDWYVDPESKALRSAIWAAFVAWYEEAYNRKPRVGKIKFYEALIKEKTGGAKFEVQLFEGVRYIKGLRVGKKVDSEDRH